MSMAMKIIVDVMGGDNAPGETVRGVLAAAKEYDAQFIIVGDEAQINVLVNAENLKAITPSGEVIYLEDDSETAALALNEIGTYTVTARFVVDTNNYEQIAPLTAVLTIKQVVVPVPDKNSFTYGDFLIIDAHDGLPGDFDLVANDDSHLYTYLDIGDGKVANILVAYDIVFNKAGTQQPVVDGSYTVKMLIPTILRSKELAVVYIDDNGNCTDMGAVRSEDGKYMVFDTTHFSTYAIVEITDAAVVKDPVDLTWLWIVLAVIVVLALVVIIILLLKKKGGNDDDTTGGNDDDTTGGNGDDTTGGNGDDTTGEDTENDVAML